jgi:uncharacterized membrane protein YdjX (TVP38/TMEM64 family)
VSDGDTRAVTPVDAIARRRWTRALLLVAVLGTGAALARWSGLPDLLHLDGFRRLTEAIHGYGAWAPAVYITGYVVAKLSFFPALPLTLLGGLVFGPLWGTLYASVAATLGASVAFLAARYAVRGLVEGWLARSPRLARLDEAVAKHGWRILMITRLVPLFPFTLQNFAYGVTRIHFGVYVAVSWVCMLPGTFAYALAASAFAEGDDPRHVLGYLGVAAVMLVALSLVPAWIGRRSRVAAALELRRP